LRILFVTSNRIGDAVLSSGVLAQLVERHPEAKVTVACGSLPASLFADLPQLERLHVMTRKKRGAHWLSLWSSCIGHYWSQVADVRGSALGWLLLAGKRMATRSEPWQGHKVEELARQLKLPSLPHPRLWVSDQRDQRIAAQLGDGPPILAVAPAANWFPKQWPEDRFIAAIQRLTAPGAMLDGARLAVFGAPTERQWAEPVLQAVPPERRLDCIGQSDLLDSYAILRRSAFFLGNDSGMMHLAAAAGIPTLGLFGPSPEERYGPWGDKALAVRGPRSYREMVFLNPDFDHKSQDNMMLDLTVDRVVEAAEALWTRCR